MYLSEIPGYTRACQRADRLEDYWRDFAFLGIDETLRFAGGHSLDVKPLTLRIFIQLCAVRSPFLVGGRVRAEHIAQILWRISPAYDGGKDPEVRKGFVAAISRLPFDSAIRTIDRFLDRQLRDRPPVPVKTNGTRADTSYAAMIIHCLASAYGWSGEEILDLPMPRIFQYLRKIHRSNDPDMGYWNPIRDRLTRRVTRRYLKTLNDAIAN